ncbi:ATP-binding protein [Arenibaculum pallidiluteum]|uniref:ATP-binding protein n=1 Tax=Arenibaculum pallidiluteum TaxID=2812559 RepID=UPI002E2DA99A|nr:ATP-binding protein [Arenibaculum pallidiluteum]
MTTGEPLSPERVLVLAPRGRDAAVAVALLGEANLEAEACPDLPALLREVARGAGLAVLTEEVLRTADLRPLSAWLQRQPPWSDFPFLLLTERGGGLERNSELRRLQHVLGNVALLERPFHPSTLVSAATTALRGRRRQYEARARLDELHELATTLERRVAEEVAEKLAAEARVSQLQKMDALGQLTGGVVHDFNNLLQALAACLRLVDRKVKDPEIAPLLDAGRQAVDRGARLTQQLLGFARREALRPEPTDIRAQLLGMTELLVRALRADIELQVAIEPGLWPVKVDPTQFELAVLNLALNARDALPGGGQLTIAAQNAAAASGSPAGVDGDFVRLTVSDTGTGMPPAVLARVFEPFFTTKAAGKGSGLGLSQVHGFARQSGGVVEIESAPGRGTTVTLLLPRSAEVPAVETTVPPSAPDEAAGRRILMVEDDPLVAGIVGTALEEAGFVVQRAVNAEEALAALEREAPDLLFTDVVMPGMNGVELALEARRRHPELPVLLATGYSEDVAAVGGRFRVLAKPYQIEPLVEALLDGFRRSP